MGSIRKQPPCGLFKGGISPKFPFQYYLVRKIANNIWHLARFNHAEIFNIRDRPDNYQADPEHSNDAHLRQFAAAGSIPLK
ncbi:hypothetical protein TRIP_C60002 [Candidatus Zixiibacteriota bacterium]|nr:hypothetical protein TRIP_C60002 [candidate division Zixibacteria bacterium]